MQAREREGKRRERKRRERGRKAEEDDAETQSAGVLVASPLCLPSEIGKREKERGKGRALVEVGLRRRRSLVGSRRG
jgi:hypothetical protein